MGCEPPLEPYTPPKKVGEIYGRVIWDWNSDGNPEAAPNVRVSVDINPYYPNHPVTSTNATGYYLITDVEEGIHSVMAATTTKDDNRYYWVGKLDNIEVYDGMRTNVSDLEIKIQ